MRSLQIRAAVRGLAAGIAALALCAAPKADARPHRVHRMVAQAPDATSARTNRAVVIRKKPNARAAAVAKLPKDTVVTIEKAAEKGWIRIRAIPPGKRAKNVTGFVLAGSVTLPEVTAATPPQQADDTPTTDTPITPEQRVTADQVVVHDKPGEKQNVVATVPAGATVTVEAERGRWLRVRSGKVVGYIARTQLLPPQPVAEERPTELDAVPSKWSSARGTSSDLYAEVHASAVLREEPTATAPPIASLARSTRVAVIDATSTAGWVRARDPQGQEGWIAAAELGNGPASSALDETSIEDTRAPSSNVAIATTSPATSPRHMPVVLLDVELGYRILGMDFSSNGSTGLSNYVVSADAGAVAVHLDAAPIHIGAFSVGVDARAQLSRSSPGIEYMGPTLPSGKIPFSTFEGEGGVRVGMRVRRLFVVALRGGAHYDAFVAQDVENAATLPRESLLGATVGARVDIAPPDSRVTATLHGDALVAGSRKQTPGLEDGTSSTAHGVWGGMVVRVRLARHVSLLSGYDFGRITTTWSGDSVRMPGVTRARRVDSTQLVQLGVSVEM